ncbi:MAG: hypothetical protein KAI47_12920, partial [Deltaproteobacteria bacterium]|nr:hypothetical protein [Deltaproteobacteria bacterium]
MAVKTVYSDLPTVDAACTEIGGLLGDEDPKVVLFFASSRYEPEAVARGFAEAFPEATTLGCTTAGEIVSGKMLKDSIVAMSLSADMVGDVSVQVLEHVG